jgi:hypothetical protein
MRKAALASVAIITLAVVAGAASIAAASPTAEPATVTSRTLSLDVHFSPFSPLHLNPHPDPQTGFGFGDEITFHDLLFSHGRQAGDEGGSCVIVDGSQLLANCTEVIRLQRGTITAQFAERATAPQTARRDRRNRHLPQRRRRRHPSGVRKRHGQADTPPARPLPPVNPAGTAAPSCEAHQGPQQNPGGGRRSDPWLPARRRCAAAGSNWRRGAADPLRARWC